MKTSSADGDGDIFPDLMTLEQLIEQADQRSFSMNSTTLITAFTVCYLRHQQRHNTTNCAREHTTEKYLKELGTS